jgi:hypothetical protein
MHLVVEWWVKQKCGLSPNALHTVGIASTLKIEERMSAPPKASSKVQASVWREEHKVDV